MIELTGSQNKALKLSNKLNDFIVNNQPHFLHTLRNNDLLNELAEVGQTLASQAKTLCLVGFGGSSLGVKALYSAINFKKKDHKILFFDNIDAFDIEQKINSLDLKDCHWLFITKSGETAEVQAVINYVSQIYSQSQLSLAKISTVITTLNNNTIHSWAQENKVPSYSLPEDVGGRFCIFTSCGLIPMAFMGADLVQFKHGAYWAKEQPQLVSQLCNELLSSFQRDEWIHLYWSYSESFLSFGLWLQQLWMESLGKEKNIDGLPAERVSSLFVARGVSDQHSILQQISDGHKDKFLVFIEDNRSQQTGDLLESSLFESQKNLVGQSIGQLLKLEKQGTVEALQEKNISCLSLKLKETNEQSMAALMSIYMMAVLAIADELRVNPLNQPGVESSKKKTKELLSRLNR